MKLDHDWYPEAIPANVSVGERCWIYSTFAFIHSRAKNREAVRIGHDTGIYNGTFFELGEEASIKIGDFCSLVGVIINTNGRVEIGDYSFFAHEVVIADRAFSSPRRPGQTRRSRQSGEGEIAIGDNCWVGMRAVLLAGTKLGESCIVGANAVVALEAPPYSVIAGNPARIVGTTCHAGDQAASGRTVT